MVDRLTRADLAPHVGDAFLIRRRDDADPVEAELIEVDAIGAAPAGDATTERRQPFSIVFRTPADVELPQSIYRVEHPSTGPLDVFLVPIGRDESGMCYEAVFN